MVAAPAMNVPTIGDPVEDRAALLIVVLGFAGDDGVAGQGAIGSVVVVTLGCFPPEESSQRDTFCGCGV